MGCCCAKRTDTREADILESDAIASQEESGAENEVLSTDRLMSPEDGPANVGNHSQANYEPNGNEQIIVVPNEKKEHASWPVTANTGVSVVSHPQNNWGNNLQPVTTEGYQMNTHLTVAQMDQVPTDYSTIQAPPLYGHTNLTAGNVLNDNPENQSFLSGTADDRENVNVTNDYMERASAPMRVDGHSTIVADDYVENGGENRNNDAVVLRGQNESLHEKDGKENVVVFNGREYKKTVYDEILGQYVYTLE